MSDADRQKWNTKYAARPISESITADDWLLDGLRRIREGGLCAATPLPNRLRMLDIACGLGHNAIRAALDGCDVDAVDISPVGLQHAAALAQRHAADVRWIEADLDDWLPEPAAYDLVTVFRFWDRERIPMLARRALRPGGLLLLETFSADQLNRPDSHIRNPAFTLGPDDLPRLFADFRILEHRFDSLPDRSVVRFLAQSPPPAAAR